MSRFALSRDGVETPIDWEGFTVFVRWSSRTSTLTGDTLWYATDQAAGGVLVASDVRAFVADSLPLLLRQLKNAGFRDVRVDMASVPGPVKPEEGEAPIPIKPRKVDPWAYATGEGVRPPEGKASLIVELESELAGKIFGMLEERQDLKRYVQAETLTPGRSGRLQRGET